jgi:hypothetical protein
VIWRCYVMKFGKIWKICTTTCWVFFNPVMMAQNHTWLVKRCSQRQDWSEVLLDSTLKLIS